MQETGSQNSLSPPTVPPMIPDRLIPSGETTVLNEPLKNNWSSSAPLTVVLPKMPSPSAYNSLPPLKTAKSLNFLRFSPNKHIKDHPGSNTLPSRPIPVIVSSSGLINRSDAAADGGSILSLGPGIEFLRSELGGDCLEPYMNPRLAPSPPNEGGVTDSANEVQELAIPEYVFERRGSATSHFTVVTLGFSLFANASR
jgi:hypothetical protein